MNIREIILVLIFVTIVGLVIFSFSGYECAKSRTEIQYQQPIGYVSGSISIPLGNVRPVEVTICEDYRKKIKN